VADVGEGAAPRREGQPPDEEQRNREPPPAGQAVDQHRRHGVEAVAHAHVDVVHEGGVGVAAVGDDPDAGGGDERGAHVPGNEHRQPPPGPEPPLGGRQHEGEAEDEADQAAALEPERARHEDAERLVEKVREIRALLPQQVIGDP